MKKGKAKNKNKHICPSCGKPYQSMVDMENHCRKIHGKSFKDLQEIKENSQMTIANFMKEDGEDE